MADSQSENLVKRGRGRPKGTTKLGGNLKPKTKVPGRGRGRPPTRNIKKENVDSGSEIVLKRGPKRTSKLSVPNVPKSKVLRRGGRRPKKLTNSQKNAEKIKKEPAESSGRILVKKGRGCTKGANAFKVPVNGRGRPKKFVYSENGQIMAVKIGPGRPKRTSKSGDPSVTKPKVSKRGRGRPKKLRSSEKTQTQMAVKIGHGHSKRTSKSEEPAMKKPKVSRRGRGRPKKLIPSEKIQTQMAVKRGRGRPRKTTKSGESYSGRPNGKVVLR